MLARVAIAALAIAACHKKRPAPDAAPPPPIDAAADARPIDAPPKVAAKPTPTQVAVGTASACAVMSDHTLRCWGKNDHGQLGDGSTTDSATAVTPPLHGVREVQLAEDTACALLEDASVSCWGHLAWQGKTADTPKPTGILGVKGVKQLFVLARSACGRVADDTLVCWGGVDPGGHATATSGDERHYPTPLAELAHATALHATAAMLENGDVWLGAARPAKTPLAAAVEIAERDGMVCRRDAAGGVRCAGDRLACLPPIKEAKAPPPAPKPKANKRKPPPKPVKVVPPPPPPKPEPTDFALELPPAKQLAFTSGLCVVTTSGKLACGDGCGKPTLRHGLDKLAEVAGDCGRAIDGSIRCWRGEALAPIDGVVDAKAFAAINTHGCALLGDATVTCWDERASAAHPIAL